jgi:hypothetical protein
MPFLQQQIANVFQALILEDVNEELLERKVAAPV